MRFGAAILAALGCATGLGVGNAFAEETQNGKPDRKPSDTRKIAPASGKASTASAPAYTPTSGYEKRAIEGWTSIYVHKDLLTTQKAIGDELLRAIQVKLYDITRVVPAKALAELRKVPIWIEYANPKCRAACYHPSKRWLMNNGFNPAKARCVELGNAKNCLRYLRSQPSMILHELAHGYHDRVLPGGYGNKELKARYEKARKAKLYDKVLYFTGKTNRAYAMKNPMEYFAELSEAMFGTNDIYPFVRAEIKVHDPESYQLVRKLWGMDGT